MDRLPPLLPIFGKAALLAYNLGMLRGDGTDLIQVFFKRLTSTKGKIL